LEEVGRAFGVTRERVRQIESRALMKLKSYRETQRLRE
ncbi:MAG: sigma factor-like helix-turn-helix DNA-binding protein, partial [Pseudolabrys sp.]